MNPAKKAHALKLSNSVIASPFTYDPTGQPPPGEDPKTDAETEAKQSNEYAINMQIQNISVSK